MSRRLKVAGALAIALALAAVTAGSIAQVGAGSASAANGQKGCELHGQAKDRKSTRLNSSHLKLSRMPSSA